MRGSFEEIVLHMRNIGEQLTPYTVPQADLKLEEDLSTVRFKEVCVDGYQVILYFSKSDYGTHFLETIQVLGKNTPFLPFALVTKIAVKFLGSHNLSLVELLRDSRKIYYWHITVDKRGCPLESMVAESHQCNFEGLRYNYVDHSQVNFY